MAETSFGPSPRQALLTHNRLLTDHVGFPRTPRSLHGLSPWTSDGKQTSRKALLTHHGSSAIRDGRLLELLAEPQGRAGEKDGAQGGQGDELRRKVPPTRPF